MRFAAFCKMAVQRTVQTRKINFRTAVAVRNRKIDGISRFVKSLDRITGLSGHKRGNDDLLVGTVFQHDIQISVKKGKIKMPCVRSRSFTAGHP